MSEKENQQDNGISESELIEVANSLDKIVAKPKAEGQIKRQDLPVGIFVARVLSSFLNKGKNNGIIYMNFKMSVIGYLQEDDNGQSQVIPRNYGTHTKGFSLANEYCVNMLIDLFRDYDVPRTDGEPITTGGDLLRSRGVPDGSWVIITVKHGKDKVSTFISGIYKPSLKLTVQARSIYEKQHEAEVEITTDGDDTDEPRPTKKGMEEPPF